MYEITRHTKKFNTDVVEDMADYDEIINNPLCVVLNERKEKLSNKEFDGEGKMISLEEHVILVVTWEEKDIVL